MALNEAANLVNQYNKKDKSIDSRADQGSKFNLGSWSYLNTYDALYDRYSTSKNFDAQMWNTALKYGEQDTYISLLDATKDTTLSNEFYNNSYYDYEVNMLEMYSQLADNTEESLEERFHQVWDHTSQSFVEESLGEMTEKQFIDYQIQNTRAYRSEEIERQIDQQRKDNLGFWGQFGHTIGATFSEFGEGLLTAMTGILDFFIAPLAAIPISMIDPDRDYLDAFVDYFGEFGLTAQEKKTVRASLDEYERTHTFIRDIDGNVTNVGKYVAGISNSIGMMIPAIIVNIVAPGAGMPLFYTSIFSNNMHENALNPNIAKSPSWTKITNAALKTGVEVLVEWGLDKILGGTIGNTLLGLAGKSSIKTLNKFSGIQYLIKSALQEGLEEFLQDFSTNLVDQFYGLINEGYAETGVTFQTLIDSFLIGALSSVFMSGGAVAGNSIVSAATKGKTDIFVENKDGTPKKVRGLQKLAFRDIIQGYNNALEKLGKEKVNVGRNLKLAQEVQAAMSALTGFYSSFSKERIQANERLLQRIIRSEERAADPSYQQTWTGQMTTAASSIGQTEYARAQLNAFATSMKAELKSMVGGVSARYEARINKVLDNNAEKLSAAGVTEVKSVTTKDDGRRKKNPKIAAIDNKLQGKLEKFAKDYDFVFEVDGHIAIEQDGVLFVSEGWLENYETHEIYKFLEQTHVLTAIMTDSVLEPMLEAVVEANEKFTGRKNVTVERALMDLLFNESVYQNFVLSNGGANMHKFSDFIFRLHSLVRGLAQTTGLTKERQNYLNQIYEQIKQTMRKPTIKAILNWNMNPQKIGADSVLTEADKQFINQYQVLKNQGKEAAKGGKIKADYRRRVETLRDGSHFSESEKALIDKGLSDDATNKERLMAVLMLDLADDMFVNVDFENKMNRVHARQALNLLNEIMEFEHDINEEDFNVMLDDLFVYSQGLIDKSLLLTLLSISNNTNTSLDERFGALKDISLELYNKLSIVRDSHFQEVVESTSPGIFVVPYQAVSGSDTAASIQFKSDIVNEFERIYGISPRLSIAGDLSGVSMAQFEQIQKEMGAIGARDYTDFTIRKLESMLNGGEIEYVVTPEYKIVNTRKTNVVNDFVIVQKIPAEQMIKKDLLNADFKRQNTNFLDMFEHEETVGMFKPRKIGDFLSTNDVNKVHDWTVVAANDPSDDAASGWTDTDDKTIYVNVAKSSDYMHTFVHEVNHAIQYAYYMTQGFNEKIVLCMPDYLNYVLRNYAEIIIYMLSRKGAGAEIREFRTALINYKATREWDIHSFSSEILRAGFYLGYRLVQGELWAEYYEHNGKLIPAVTMTQDITGDSYLVSPEGQKFKIPAIYTFSESYNLKQEFNLGPDPIQTENALARTFDNTLGVRAKGPVANPDVTNTYHSKFTKNSSELIQDIINPGLPITTQIRATIDEIIIDPENYLSQEIIDDIVTTRGELTEGAVYHYLQDYFESKYGNVSIDRDGNTHEYLFVDNNAFDDFLLPTLANNNNREKGLAAKYESEEGIGLNQFYSTLQLTRLGLPSGIKVIANENVDTETVIDDISPNGVIYIQTDPNMTNADFIDALNHEFRHIVQHHHQLEQGFTADFVVTKEMLADIKTHVPEIFTDPELIAIAKKNNADPDTFIAQQFVYYMIGGEQNAYSFRSVLLNAKPAYATTEAGKPTIYMPWYNAKTGEGRWETSFLAARKDDKSTTLPSAIKTRKYKSRTVTDNIAHYTYTNDRHFTKKEAQGTNLIHFYKTNTQNQMDPDLKNFIISTTGREDELSKHVVNAIKKGKLTKDALFKWFRNVRVSEVTQTTFDLMNKWFFQNEAIQNMSELDSLVNLGSSKHGSGGLSFWYAAAIVLRKEGIDLESLIAQNSVEKFINFIESLEGSEWAKKIEKQQANFNHYMVENKTTGNLVHKEIGLTDEATNYIRVFAMKYFDGSLGGAFITARNLRKFVRDFQTRETSDTSLDSPVSSDAKRTLGEVISETGLTGDAKAIGNDIIALYDLEQGNRGMSKEEMIDVLAGAVRNYYENKYRESAKKNLGQRYYEKETQDKIQQATENAVAKYRENLANQSEFDVRTRYEQVTLAEMTSTQTTVDITNTKEDVGVDLRVNIVGRITRAANRLIKFVNSGRAVFENLPEEVQNMFTKEVVKDGRSKNTVYKLKPEVYSVGRGAVRGERDFGRDQNFKKDTTRISENANLLKQAADDARDGVFATKDVSRTVKKLQNRLDKKNKAAIRKAANTNTNARETEFRTRKKRRTSDQPNTFTIVSSIDMPEVLRGIYDTSFEDMADTRVVFASKDADGNLLTKENTKEFKSNLEHEISNWDAFYEANREALLKLTRQDVFDIVEFIESGAVTINGPAGKLAAFEMFILGYLVDATRRDLGGWNLSEAEKQRIVDLYEAKASAHGSGLAAVGQMLSVIDPMKKVRQRWLERYDITDEQLEPLFAAVDALGREKTTDGRKEKGAVVAKEMRDLEQLMYEQELGVDGNTVKRGWGKRVWSKIKSFRYSSMLSSPITWIRNVVSNVVNLVFNRSADYLGKFIFSDIGRKGYRQEQWDITGTKITEDVRMFIEQNIKNSELFALLYDGTTKYSDQTKVKKQKELFITMIMKSLEQKYAAEHRFDNNAANFMVKFIDKMISDKAFIKLASSRYLGKILTIEVARGNVDLSQGLSMEVLNLFAESVILANSEYMRKRGWIVDAMAKIKEKSPLAYEVLSFWQPFINSSFNWFSETLKYTPFGLVKAIYNMVKLESRITANDAKRARGDVTVDSRITEHMARRDIGKGVLGMLLMTVGILLGATGMIRIDDEDEKFYMYVGDLKIDISNIFGTSSVLVGVSIASLTRDDFTMNDMLSYITDVYLEGFLLKDMFDRHKYNNGMWEAMLTETESILKSFVPQFLQLVVRATNNENIKYTPGFAGMWERWLNSWIPTQPLGERKINPYTGEVSTKYALPVIGEFLKSGLFGPRIYWEEVDEVEAFARTYGVNKNELTGQLTVNGKAYTLPKLSLNKKYGELNKVSLASIQTQKHSVQMPNGTYKTLSWSQMTDDQKARVIERTITYNADIAKIYVWTQSEDKKYYASDSMYQALRKLGITKNVYKGDKGFVE